MKIKITILSLFATVISIAQSEEVCFENTTYQFAGGGSGGILISGDFNNDQILDLAGAPRAVEQGISVAIGDGTGGFSLLESNSYPSNEVYAIATADFNNDGTLDIVGTLPFQNDVKIFLGDGTGLFGAPVIYPVEGTGYLSYGIATADFNNDENADIVVNGNGNDKVAVLFGDGAGSFALPIFFTAANGVVYIGAADVNNDEYADFITANRESSSISIFLGLGNGEFNLPITMDVGDYPEGLTIYDINEDGLQDIITANYSSEGPGEVSIVLNAGESNFLPASHYQAPGAPSVVSIADFNSDGYNDIALAAYYGVNGYTSNGLIILFGSQSGLFETSSFYTSFGSTLSVVPGDFNNDLKTDIATTSYFGFGYVHLNSICPPPLELTENTISNFNLYPNPASGQLSVQLPDGVALEKATFHNILGQTVLETKASTTWDVSKLASGVHFVTLVTNEGTAQLKFIKE